MANIYQWWLSQNNCFGHLWPAWCDTASTSVNEPWPLPAFAVLQLSIYLCETTLAPLLAALKWSHERSSCLRLEWHGFGLARWVLAKAVIVLMPLPCPELIIRTIVADIRISRQWKLEHTCLPPGSGLCNCEQYMSHLIIQQQQKDCLLPFWCLLFLNNNYLWCMHFLL